MNQNSDTAQALADELAALLNRIVDAGYNVLMNEDSDAVALFDPKGLCTAAVWLPYEGERRWTS